MIKPNLSALILLTIVGIIEATDKSPNHLLDGKPVATSAVSRHFDDSNGASANVPSRNETPTI